MPLPCLPRILTVALFAGGLVSAAASAEERWYQVELLVFSHEAGAGSEQWDPLPELRYPPASRFLVYPARVAAREAEYPGASTIDEYGRQLVVLEDPQQATGITDPATVATPVDETAALEPIEPIAAAAEEPARPTPYVALPHARRELHGKSAYMQRTGRFRTLFHETWVQPVAAEDEALALVLDDSGALQTWPRLQGSIKLYLSRFLHIETDLWLNTTGDYLPATWQMPAPPLGPPSLVVEAPEPALEEALVQADPGLLYDEAAPDPNALAEEDAGPVYPWRHAVRVEQRRRMRSNELHYLDHPLLGLVVKLTPLDEEQLAAMADAEAEDALSR